MPVLLSYCIVSFKLALKYTNRIQTEYKYITTWIKDKNIWHECKGRGDDKNVIVIHMEL